MVKHFNVIMAGVISGIVALFTSYLGISGTIIGSVISSFLYQLLSSYSQEKYEEYDERGDTRSRNISIKKPNFSGEIVYVFPIVVIILIELLFILTDLHYSFAKAFNLLEMATDNNLFRVMGIALVVLGIYPLLGTNDIDKKNGYVLFIIGFLVFLRGIGDMTSIFYILYDRIISVLDPFFALFVVIVLTAVVINIKPSERKNNVSHRYPKPNGRGSNHPGSPQHYYVGENSEDLPIYEEDYIYVENPDDPSRPIRRKILKKVKPAAKDDFYYDDVLEENPAEKTFNTNSEDLDYSSRKRIRRE